MHSYTEKLSGMSYTPLRGSIRLGLSGCLLLTSCAGPTTPFGALSIWAPAKKVEPSLEAVGDFMGPLPSQELTRIFVKRAANVSFSPKRQVLHNHSEFTIEIEDHEAISNPPVIRVFYNGFDVSQNFLSQAKAERSNGDKRLSLTFSDLRILPTTDNRIEVLYQRNPRAPGIYAEYLPPSCFAFGMQKVRSTGEFNPPDRLIASVETVSRARGINPSFLAGLIAQESGFKTYALSAKRALGLTQITSVAEEEIIQFHPDFPRFPHLNEIEIPILKWMISTGKINERNEWRLHEERSLQGALTFLEHIKRYWEKPENWELIARNYKNPHSVLGDLILASYHSGPARIKRTLTAYGAEWLKAPNVVDARLYVNRITSYCQYFSDEELAHENET